MFSFSSTVFIHSSLLTLYSKRHSQDLNSYPPKLLRAQAPAQAEQCVDRGQKRPAHVLIRGLCVCVCTSSHALHALAISLPCMTIRGLPHTGCSSCFLWSHCFSLHTHTHAYTTLTKRTHTHSTSCVSIYLDVIVCNIINKIL